MLIHYFDPDAQFDLHVPNGINPFWTKYLLRYVITKRRIYPHGSWVRFSE